MKMKFSVLMASHNGLPHIKKALESIAEQIFDDYELIVVCDSCEDGTEEIARQYADIVESVDYHCGGKAYNRALELAHGDYILFLDDDDWFLHEYVFSDLAKQLPEDSPYDAVVFSFIYRGYGFAGPRGNGGKWFPAPWCKVYRRESIGDARFGEEKYNWDMPFFKSYFAEDKKVAETLLPLVYYNYLRPGSLTWEQEGGEK